ncbi:hypothetical protein PQQ59_10310 [Paraburkholderia aspalathi]|uniref:hypothetical protein n=1 Tax=Paraburkholderia aspalathi TaxID=1324617 RepID=UPI0038B91409
MAELTGAMHESAPPPVVDSRPGDHVTAGSIDQSQPSGSITKSTANAQEPVVPAPALAVAPASGPAAAQVTAQPKPEARPKQAPSTAVASVNVQDSGAPKVTPAQRAQRGQDGVDHRAITTRGATPETDELVRESAKLDPSLPPPDMSAARASMDQSSSKPGKGSNPVAAAMTEQLVKESAKLDPSLPPPK